MNQLHRRAGAAPSNFPTELPAGDSELAQQLTRDPYVLDFLDLTRPAAERDLETALVQRLQAFLLVELGHGFAFIGRQYHFEVDGDDFYIDLLFFNWAQSRFVVVELKIGRFQPEYTGKLGFYVAWVEDTLRDKDRHSPTIGILLCAGRNDNVVRYSLASTTAPLAVADYTYDTLPTTARDAVPPADQLTALADSALDDLNCPPSPAEVDPKPGRPTAHGPRPVRLRQPRHEGLRTPVLRPQHGHSGHSSRLDPAAAAHPGVRGPLGVGSACAISVAARRLSRPAR